MDPNSLPLISVGIPTYNRPEGLRKTLECITRQTYQNLEIIVSDNCSTTKESEFTVKEFMKKDPRIRFFKQTKNRGSFFNFNFVLKFATGKYFMWAADDDEWDSFFIEKCANVLEKSSDKYVAAMMEAQYFEGKKKFRFFPEGRPFYTFYTQRTFNRLIYTLKNNYGNLFYSLFFRNVLFFGKKTIFESFNMKSINEIFLLLFVCQNGNLKVIPEIGIYKQAPKKTVQQAKWEIEGGLLPNSNYIPHFSIAGLKYHIRAFQDINSISSLLNLNFLQRWVLKMYCLCYIMQHFFYLTIQRKPRNKSFH